MASRCRMIAARRSARSSRKAPSRLRLVADNSAGNSRVEQFTPIPITANRGGSASTRIPASLRPPASRSFGHFDRAATPVRASTASRTATPARRGNTLQEPGSDRGRMMIEASRASPGAAIQPLPRRPLPEVWWSAATTALCGAPSLAHAIASSLVDPQDANNRTALATGSRARRMAGSKLVGFGKCQLTASRSTTKTKVSFGPIAPPAPRSP